MGILKLLTKYSLKNNLLLVTATLKLFMRLTWIHWFWFWEKWEKELAVVKQMKIQEPKPWCKGVNTHVKFILSELWFFFKHPMVWYKKTGLIKVTSCNWPYVFTVKYQNEGNSVFVWV